LWPIRNGGKWGFIDRDNTLVIPAKFGSAGTFRPDDLYATVTVGDEVWLIDRTGRKVAGSQGGFTMIGRTAAAVYRTAMTADRDTMVDVISLPTGRILATVESEVTGDGFPIAAKTGGLWGFMGSTGEFVIPPQFAKAFAFSEGLAAVKSAEGKWGYIGLDGKWVIEPIYGDVRPFSEGLAPVFSGGQWSVINRQGHEVITGLEGVGGFQSGVAVALVGREMGLIDRTGSWVLRPQRISIGDFSDGLAAARVYDQQGKLQRAGYIDNTGKFIISLDGAGELGDFICGRARVVTAQRSGYIDKGGRWLYVEQ
jgi:hypothetical protein